MGGDGDDSAIRDFSTLKACSWGLNPRHCPCDRNKIGCDTVNDGDLAFALCSGQSYVDV